MAFIRYSSILFVSALLTACETFLAHYRMPENLVTIIGKLNSTVNHCLASGELNKPEGYAFNAVSAQFIDIAVLDEDVYRKRYDEGRTEMEKRGSVEVDGKRYGCVRLGRDLPEMTAGLFKLYSNVSTQLHQARAAELTQMAGNLNNLGRNSYGGSTYVPTYEWPKLTYVDQPKTTNYLVNTSRGLVQCRVTNKNYVFCM
jgi:hypothetical protein